MSAKQVKKIRGKPISSKGFTAQKGTRKIQKKARAADKKTMAKAKKLRL